MEHRRATTAELNQIMEIVRGAQAYLARQGVDQWQDGYPPVSAFASDIADGACHLFLDNERIAGVITVRFGDEESYRTLTGGAWLTAGPYAVIHRIAVREDLRGTGLTDQMMDFAEDSAKVAGCAGIRVDTHADNIPMRHVAARHGFALCGQVLLYRGTPQQMPRIAFEKKLK